MAGLCRFVPPPRRFRMMEPLEPGMYQDGELDGLIGPIIQRKRDGLRMYAANDSLGRWRLYPEYHRGEYDRRLDHIREYLNQLALPLGTLLVGDLYLEFRGRDDLSKLAWMLAMKDQDAALDIQKWQGWTQLSLVAMLDYGGRDLTCLPYDQMLHEMRVVIVPGKRRPAVYVAPTLYESVLQAQRMAVDGGWIGLVIYTHGYRWSYRLDGRIPVQLGGCYYWQVPR